MADMITAPELRKLKQEHPQAAVVCYVNSPAEVKAESDYCCTSSNAAEVVESIPREKEIIFVPDRHLGETVSNWTGRNLIFWPGYCPTHAAISEKNILDAKRKNPDALVLAHPECNKPVKKLADKLFSTGQMLKFVQESNAGKFIIATEMGITHSLKKVNPNAEYIVPTERAVCPNMKKITLDKVLTSLEEMRFKVEVPDDISNNAKVALQRMVQVLPAN
jgi:quinolinate synthase